MDYPGAEWQGTAWAGTAAVRTRAAQPAPRPMTGFGLEGGLAVGGVTPTTVLGLSSVQRCLEILTNGVSKLPWIESRGNLELPPSRIVSRPQAIRTRREWTSLVVATLALFDVCYLFKAGGTDAEGVPIGLWPIDPSMIQPATYDTYSMVPPMEFYVGQDRIARDELVILTRGPLPTISENLGGLLNLARTTFIAALAAERYASRYWQSGGSPTTVLETPAELDDAEATSLSDRWYEKRSRGPDYAPVLSSGLTAKSFGADPTAQAAVEARKEQNADVGRYFGIPTSLLNAPAGDSETYGTTEQQGIGLLNFTLSNYIGAIEDGITDLLPGGRRMRMDPWSLTAGTQYTRAQTWQLATGGQPWMDVEEVRDREGLPPREIVPAQTTAPVAVPATGGPQGGQ